MIIKQQVDTYVDTRVDTQADTRTYQDTHMKKYTYKTEEMHEKWKEHERGDSPPGGDDVISRGTIPAEILV